MALGDDIETIEEQIRRLQIEWDKFFGGLERKPPTDLKTRLEAMLRKHANAEIRNNTERFRYQSLTAKYNTLNELWAKKLRAKEEGKPMGVHGLKADILPPPPPPPPAPSGRPAGASRQDEYRVTSPERDAQKVQALYKEFMSARQRAGESAPVKFDSFQKLISQQASRILGEKGARAVDFRLETKEGKVTVKAKVVK